jgi:glutathione S-transferase
VEKGLRQFHFAAAILDAHLAGRTYVCGDRLSLADFAIGADLILADRAELPLSPYANVRRWGARLAELPAWRAALAMQERPPAAAA